MPTFIANYEKPQITTFNPHPVHFSIFSTPKASTFILHEIRLAKLWTTFAVNAKRKTKEKNNFSFLKILATSSYLFLNLIKLTDEISREY